MYDKTKNLFLNEFFYRLLDEIQSIPEKMAMRTLYQLHDEFTHEDDKQTKLKNVDLNQIFQGNVLKGQLFNEFKNLIHKDNILN